MVLTSAKYLGLGEAFKYLLKQNSLRNPYNNSTETSKPSIEKFKLSKYLFRCCSSSKNNTFMVIPSEPRFWRNVTFIDVSI